MSKLHGRENDSVEVVAEVQKSEVALREEAILEFWQQNDIFNKSVETPAGSPPVGNFVFYDGPPFATGLPHYGHILAGTIKDAIPRFWTMNGHRVERKWGWDCHGLPLENLIEKELGLGTKRDIEEYGVKNFNEKARGAVLRYADDWRQIMPRMGRFVDMEHDYKTMDSSYTESVWWVFKSLHEKGLVYEGFKSMHLCPRCGTTLSNFEVNQGYKDIKDIAVTVKLKLDAGQKIGDFVTDENTSLLVWTTTPWTLPGNMAAAVNNDIEYVKCAVSERYMHSAPYDMPAYEYVILAEENLKKMSDSEERGNHQIDEKIFPFEDYGVGDKKYKVESRFKGSALVGKSYQPPFNYFENQDLDKTNAWKIWHADYVEVGEEGTGAVHIAPAYGDDDMKLAQEHNFPIVHHVDEAGHFKSFITAFAGRLVKPKDDEQAGVDHKDTDIEILRALQATGKIFKKENITHSYPHCWRCDTPLLNYATTSWFVRVSEMKDELVAANNQVKWIPEHVGTNRFGKWLEGARDWAISRQRYWGAPLPIWRNPETKEVKVLGSLSELQQYVQKSGNQYFMMRHGEAEHNVSHIMSSSVEDTFSLTEKGKSQVATTIADLKDRKIDLIYVSPLVRTRDTADLVATALGLSSEQVIVDDRLHETLGGIFEGKPLKEWYAYRDGLTSEQKLTDAYDGGESWLDIRKRMLSVLFEIEAMHQGKNILFISHGMPLRLLKWGAECMPNKDMVHTWETGGDMPHDCLTQINFTPFPHNEHLELDFHRPYIDEIVLEENGVQLERVPDVFDCWFESGSMPYAQHHFMGENQDLFLQNCFPAQFIAEGLDQTRGWFYSLIVLGTALFGKSPYENVIVNGLVLAEDGKKMSKKLQNYPDPMDLVARCGADAMRFYLLSSPVIKGEDLNFSEKEVLELQRKNLVRLHNVLAMYEQYQDGTPAHENSENVLDRWILARLSELVNETTTGYKTYELDKATRPITDFIDDLSVWYLRRSRERLKGEDENDKALALATLRYTLRTLALVMAPVMPFYAEYLFQAVKEEDDAESVHLGKWPEVKSIENKELLTNMLFIRSFATMGLNLRTSHKIGVKQPLNELWVAHSGPKPAGWDEVEYLLKEELNVRKITLEPRSNSVGATFALVDSKLDTELTKELIVEGNVREFMRVVQQARKDTGLIVSDQITLKVNSKLGDLLKEHLFEVSKVVGAKSINVVPLEDSQTSVVVPVLGDDYLYEIEKVI